jgi:hypothetical protein
VSSAIIVYRSDSSGGGTERDGPAKPSLGSSNLARLIARLIGDGGSNSIISRYRRLPSAEGRSTKVWSSGVGCRAPKVAST